MLLSVVALDSGSLAWQELDGLVPRSQDGSLGKCVGTWWHH